MIIEGRFSVPANQERVWACLWDIGTLASWVPGCTQAEKIDETTYKVHLEQQVTFLKASFDLILRVLDQEPQSAGGGTRICPSCCEVTLRKGLTCDDLSYSNQNRFEKPVRFSRKTR